MRTPGVLLLSASMFFACHRPHGSGTSASTSASPAAPAAPHSPLSLAFDARALTLAPHGSGYDLNDAAGHTIDRVKVDADHVKLESPDGALVVEVKRKAYGFKVEDGGKNEILKCKHDGDVFKLKRVDGTEVAKIRPTHASAGSAKIETKRDGARWTVLRGGAPVGAADGSLPATTAAFVGVTELPVEQRVAIVVFLRDLGA